MPTIHLIEGPVGAGKSTFAAKLMHEHSAPRLNLDEWMVVLFRPDRPEGDDIMAWYAERKQRCIEQIMRRDLAPGDEGRKPRGVMIGVVCHLPPLKPSSVLTVLVPRSPTA